MSKAQYVGVSGVARKVKSEYVGVSGVARKIKSGYVGIAGVARQFFQSGIPAGSIAVGSIVYLLESGSPVEYLVINQGIPSDSSRYDGSCDGTWLLRKDIIQNLAWSSRGSNNLVNSTVQSWLASTMLSKYDPNTQNAIKQVKIPYCVGSGGDEKYYTGANGLSCKVFLLSGNEVDVEASALPTADGAVVSYFKNAGSSKLIAYLNGSAGFWWLRSNSTASTRNVYGINSSGSVGNYRSNYNYGVRPALVLPKTALFDPVSMKFVSA